MSSKGPARSWTQWTIRGRIAVFALASTSIFCLLSQFYGLCPMGTFAVWILLPATALLTVLGCADRRGDLGRNLLLGSLAGLLAAVAYDVFRLPFVFSAAWGLERIVPPMNLFKVFPRFGAMLLGQPLEQASYSAAVHLLGWTYHFSNGASFGIMYLAMIGDAGRRHWSWAVLMALGLEAAMLLTPYPSVFSIAVTPRFVAATIAAHLIFGAALGFLCQRLARRGREFRPSTGESAV
jgi:hypothetical protein